MNPPILTETYAPPPLCKREILRYAGCRAADAETNKLLAQCTDEIKDKLIYKVCYCQLNVSIQDDRCDFGVFALRSNNLAKNLAGAKSVILFAATLGVEMDRLITRYSRLSPAKALMLQAIGAERIEALCDAFCLDMEAKLGTRLGVRFSPGYGDLPLETQRDIFSLLDCPKRIGLSLNNSLLMSPSKSVTAFIKISDQNQVKNKCSICDKQNCDFRSTK